MNILKKLQRICVDKQFEEIKSSKEQEYKTKGIYEQFEKYIKEESENNLNQKLPVLWSYKLEQVDIWTSSRWRLDYNRSYPSVRSVDIMWVYSEQEKKYNIIKKEDIGSDEMLNIVENYIVKLNNEQEKLCKSIFNKLVRKYKEKNWKLDMFLELNDKSIWLTYRGIREVIYFNDIEKGVTTVMKEVEKLKKEINLKYFKWEE